MPMKGVWLPIVTPFVNDEFDLVSYKNLINHYIGKGITGIIPLGTTGESPTIEDVEAIKIIEATIEIVDKRVPIYVGVGGNYTKKVVKKIREIENLGFEGILSVAPYYSRPSPEGIYQHFKAISDSTGKKIVIYNIPYRTGRNMENQTLYKLAELQNIIAVKDSCGDIKSMELILNKPADFSVLTGEDLLYFVTLSLGGDGGILASAHIDPESFIKIYNLFNSNDHTGAREHWKKIVGLIPNLFIEPNPRPIKYILKSRNLISSDETRLPITDISEKLKDALRAFI